MAAEPTLSSLAALAASAAASSSSFPAGPSSIPQFSDASSADNHKTQTKEQLRRHHIRALHKVIDESDVILLVLDARDPEGCRSRLVEEEVRRRESEGKRLVFVLNKIGKHPLPTLSFLLTIVNCMKILCRRRTLKLGSVTFAIQRRRSLSVRLPITKEITYLRLLLPPWSNC